jgi:hypothetical protein
MDLFRKTMKLVELVLKDANMKKENIDKAHSRSSLVKNLPMASIPKLHLTTVRKQDLSKHKI